ncbi:MAG TPA: hypothetical protein DCY27_10925, partial [Desulfobacterales bacterium]|nr:hypothetical protein [Desulfobacterales bacterium]
MSPINHEDSLDSQNVNHAAEPSRPVHAPRPAGGVHGPTTCGPSSEGQKEIVTPQAILGSGPRGGLGDEDSFRGALIESYLYKGDDISPHISPSAEVSASAKTKESSVAAQVQEIALAASGPYTVEEITKDVVKSLSISPYPTTPEEWQSWRKQVSNNLGRLSKQGVVERIKGKKGTYRRAGTSTETDQPEVIAESIIPETPQVDAPFQKERWFSFREANRMRPPETPGEALTINLPLHLEREFRVFPKNIVVVGAVTNSCKTTLALNLARMNMNIHQVTYINSEMSNDELAERLQGFERAYRIPWETFYHKVCFAYCGCNALNTSDMNRLMAFLDPDGINIIDYIKIHDKFYGIGECLEKIHAQLNRGIAVVFFQKDPGVNHLLGKSFPEHLPRVVMMIDIDRTTGLRCLQFTKVKFPARKGDKPEKRKIWFSIKDGVSLERTKKPATTRNQKEGEEPSDADS